MEVEVISIKKNVVCVRYGIFIINIVVENVGSKKQIIRLPRSVYIPNKEDFRTLVSIVKQAINKGVSQ